jgi:hypothetical protein
LGALVAADTGKSFLPTGLAIATAVAAPILTFVLTTLKPQSKATAFETASRELEKGIHRYELDSNTDDLFLADAIDRGIDLLNRVGSS